MTLLIAAYGYWTHFKARLAEGAATSFCSSAVSAAASW